MRNIAEAIAMQRRPSSISPLASIAPSEEIADKRRRVLPICHAIRAFHEPVNLAKGACA